MTKTTGGLLALAALILVGCPKAPEPKQLPPPPSIKSFTADKVRIEPRESVTLTFEAENATEALIVDGTGKELAFEGDANGGSVTSPGSGGTNGGSGNGGSSGSNGSGNRRWRQIVLVECRALCHASLSFQLNRQRIWRGALTRLRSFPSRKYSIAVSTDSRRASLTLSGLDQAACGVTIRRLPISGSA